MAKTPDRVPEDQLDLYKQAIATQTAFALKGGVKLPHTSTNGYMFSSLTKDGRLGLRLSKADTEQFVEDFDAIPFKNYGANIKEHVEVPDALLRDSVKLGEWLTRSYEYTNTLPPKKK